MISSAKRVERDHHRPPRQDQVEQVEAGHRQERPEHVGVLEDAGGAVVEGEHLGAGKGVEIAENAEDRGDDRRQIPRP